MNACFYVAISRLPLSTVGAIEFMGPILLAAVGARTPRNIAALVLAAGGGWILTDVRVGGEPFGYLFAFTNCALFMLYIILGHHTAQDGGTAGIDCLGIAMLIALVTVSPIGFTDVLPMIHQPQLLLAGVGVGICSLVIPYVCDQLAMARLSRATFALIALSCFCCFFFRTRFPEFASVAPSSPTISIALPTIFDVIYIIPR